MRDDCLAATPMALARFYDLRAEICNTLVPSPDNARSLGEPPRSGPATRDIAGPLAKLCGVSPAAFADAVTDAIRHGTTIDEELIASGAVSTERLTQGLAQALDLPVHPLRPSDRILGTQLPADAVRVRYLRTCDGAFHRRFFVFPTLETLAEIHRHLEDYPGLRSIACVGRRDDLQQLLARETLAKTSSGASTKLMVARPHFSAFNTVEPGQCLVFALLVSLFAVALSHEPGLVATILHLGAGLLFLASQALRVGALLEAAPSPVRAEEPGEDLPPRYSVLVALHREGQDVVEALVDHLCALDWPVSRIEIKLVCEADDFATIHAVERAVEGYPQFQIVRVPPSLPRTKPKALNTALPLVRGEFVVLFDAEDAPHPAQLREAYARFRDDRRLACLQAPLVVRNGGASFFAAMFALEYAVLFRRVLPWLAARDLPMPLGGTSNHFRREALEAVGAWDPHNVTEDADLGMRFARAGHRVGTLEYPTYEDAPTSFRVWRPQRSRWLKGWCQTWLVHMRDPLRLWCDLGATRFMVFQLLFAGLVGSALAHPFFLVAATWTVVHLLAGQTIGLFQTALFGLDLVNIVLGWAIFSGLAVKVARGEERRTLLPWLSALWVYWIVVSYALVHALVELVRAPHRWNKTPHGQAANETVSPSALSAPPRLDLIGSMS